MSDTLWIGLDLGRYRTSVCVIDDSGTLVLEQNCETSLCDIEALLAPFPASGIALMAVEAGADTHIVRKLRARGYPVAIFEARKASKFLAIRRSKTDRNDARGLADVARLGRNTVSQVYLKSLECQQLRSQLALRQKLVRVRVSTEHVIRSNLALYGRPYKSSKALGSVRMQVRTQLAQLRVEEDIDLTKDLDPLVEVCENLRLYLKRLDRTLEMRARSHPVCRRLLSVPGVGPICALSFYSAIEDPTRFRRASDVAAYLGLTPRRHQSGEMSRTRGITKTGNTLTRTHLVTAAMVLRSRAPDCALKEWVVSLRERIGGPRSKVALARKLAIVLLIVWKNETCFEAYPKPARWRGDDRFEDQSFLREAAG